jgi:pyridoxine 5-phosphate synthase
MKTRPILLGVNIDHIATIRQARGTRYPDLIQAALVAEQSGADSITAHLREDRRHIQDRDIFLLKESIHTRLNMEMAATEEMVVIACRAKPQACCLVPEKRQELTTEGGLDVAGNLADLKSRCGRLADAGIEVSLFITPDFAQIDAAKAVGAPVIELHTGTYADANEAHGMEYELQNLTKAAKYAGELGLQVNAGHGLHVHNVAAICQIPEMCELNIGHSIVAQALFSGLSQAVRDLKYAMTNARACIGHAP